MPTNTDTGLLNQGGPSDQGSQRPDPRDQPAQGSQQGRPQEQQRRRRDDVEEAQATEGEPPEQRGVSATERQGGTPDPRATTDWNHGEGDAPGGSRA